MTGTLRILVLAGAMACPGVAGALPVFPPTATAPAGPAAEPAQAVCGPYRCFAGPLWRYRSGAGFRPYRGPGFVPARPFGFAPFGFRRFGGYGGYGRFGGGFRRF